MAAIQPSEILIQAKLKSKYAETFQSYNVSYIDDWVFEGDYGYKS